VPSAICLSVWSVCCSVLLFTRSRTGRMTWLLVPSALFLEHSLNTPIVILIIIIIIMILILNIIIIIIIMIITLIVIYP
jgi:hypothetical protein